MHISSASFSGRKGSTHTALLSLPLNFMSDIDEDVMNHYTYKLTAINSKGDAYLYIGVRSSKCLPEEDTSYMSSSKSVHQAIKEGVQFNKEILQVFPSRKKAVAHEVALHSQFEVATNPEFFNKAKQTSIGFDTSGVPLSDEHKAKVSEKSKVSNAKPEVKAKKSLALKAKYADSEYKKLHASKTKEAVNKPEVKAKLKAAMERVRSEEGYHEKWQAINKEINSRPEVRSKHKDNALKMFSGGEFCKRHKKAVQKVTSSNEYKEKMGAINKEINSRPEVKAKHQVNGKKLWQDASYVEKVKANHTAAITSEKYLSNLRAACGSVENKAKIKVFHATKKAFVENSCYEGKYHNVSVDQAYNWLADNEHICLIN